MGKRRGLGGCQLSHEAGRGEGGVACWRYQIRGEGFMKGTTKNQKRYKPVKKKLLGPLFKWCRNVALLDTCLLQLAELSLSQMCDLSLTCYSGLF